MTTVFFYPSGGMIYLQNYCGRKRESNAKQSKAKGKGGKENYLDVVFSFTGIYNLFFLFRPFSWPRIVSGFCFIFVFFLFYILPAIY